MWQVKRSIALIVIVRTIRSYLFDANFNNAEALRAKK